MIPAVPADVTEELIIWTKPEFLLMDNLLKLWKTLNSWVQFSGDATGDFISEGNSAASQFFKDQKTQTFTKRTKTEEFKNHSFQKMSISWKTQKHSDGSSCFQTKLRRSSSWDFLMNNQLLPELVESAVNNLRYSETRSGLRATRQEMKYKVEWSDAAWPTRAAVNLISVERRGALKAACQESLNYFPAALKSWWRENSPLFVWSWT